MGDQPPRLTLHLVWAEHEGTILLFGSVWFGYPNALVKISTILSYVLYININANKSSSVYYWHHWDA